MYGGSVWYPMLGVSAEAGQINEPAVKGSYYEAEVPDTLDLAERGRLGLDHFLAITRPRLATRCR